MMKNDTKMTSKLWNYEIENRFLNICAVVKDSPTNNDHFKAHDMGAGWLGVEVPKALPRWKPRDSKNHLAHTEPEFTTKNCFKHNRQHHLVFKMESKIFSVAEQDPFLILTAVFGKFTYPVKSHFFSISTPRMMQGYAESPRFTESFPIFWDKQIAQSKIYFDFLSRNSFLR